MIMIMIKEFGPTGHRNEAAVAAAAAAIIIILVIIMMVVIALCNLISRKLSVWAGLSLAFISLLLRFLRYVAPVGSAPPDLGAPSKPGHHKQSRFKVQARAECLMATIMEPEKVNSFSLSRPNNWKHFRLRGLLGDK